MSRAVDQRNGRDGFVKPGELIDMRGSSALSLQDRRIFNLLVEHAWPEITKDAEHKIPISRLRGARHKGSERVGDSIRRLMTQLVEVPVMADGERSLFATQLLTDTTRTIDEDSPNAVVLYHFPAGLRRIIQDSGHWGRVKAYVMFAFSSKYALALYEAVCLRGNLRTNEQLFTVEAFREILGIEKGKYPAFPQLKQRVIDPAVIELNGLSDYTVTVEPVRHGGMQRGKLSGFRLTWAKKSSEDWQAVMGELSRPRVGRAERIRNVVDRVVTDD